MSDERFRFDCYCRFLENGEPFAILDVDDAEKIVEKLNEQQATIDRQAEVFNRINEEQQALIEEQERIIKAFTQYYEWCPQSCKAIMYFSKKKENEEVMRIINEVNKE